MTKVKPGLTARVSSDAWPSAATGVVSYVSQEAQSDDKTKAATFEVRIQLDTAARDLPLNVPALAEVLISKVTDALVVPLSCVSYRANGDAMVRESVGTGQTERPVKLGTVKDGKVQIIGDLDPGTEVSGCGRQANAVGS